MNNKTIFIFSLMLFCSLPTQSFAESSTFDSYKKSAISTYNDSVNYFKNLLKSDNSENTVNNTEQVNYKIIEKIEKRINSDALRVFNSHYHPPPAERMSDFEVIEHEIIQDDGGYTVLLKAKGCFTMVLFPFRRVYSMELSYNSDGNFVDYEKFIDPNAH